jgi:hypothetical protein
MNSHKELFTASRSKFNTRRSPIMSNHNSILSNCETDIHLTSQGRKSTILQILQNDNSLNAFNEMVQLNAYSEQLVCTLCKTPKLQPQLAILEGCNHHLCCKMCIESSLQSQISKGAIKTWCPYSWCRRQFSDNDVKNNVEQIYYIKYRNASHSMKWCNLGECGKLLNSPSGSCSCGNVTCKQCGEDSLHTERPCKKVNFSLVPRRAVTFLYAKWRPIISSKRRLDIASYVKQNGVIVAGGTF